MRNYNMGLVPCGVQCRSNLNVAYQQSLERQSAVPKDPEDAEALIAAWRTSHRVTVYLIENLPPELWSKTVPGVPRRTVRMIAAHIHNARCMWIKMMGARHGIAAPRTV